ncbi:MAG TPA: hypothetical protein VJJ78_03095 [Candidatus Saccharimonadales bacterium]|nr:hypothetical protein [Candidatus Saccharimonadales bacterium]
MDNLPSTTLPKQWVEKEPSVSEQTAGVIFMAKHIDFPSSLVIRRLTKKLAKDFDIKTLPEELVKAFEAKVVNFKPMDKGLTKIGNYKAAKVQYEQLDELGNRLYENLVISIPMQWQTFHVAYRAQKKDFKNGEKDVLKIIQSFLKSIFLQ